MRYVAILRVILDTKQHMAMIIEQDGARHLVIDTRNDITIKVTIRCVLIRLTKVGRIMVWRMSSVRPSVRPSVNIWLFIGVTTCQINFDFTDISSAPNS